MTDYWREGAAFAAAAGLVEDGWKDSPRRPWEQMAEAAVVAALFEWANRPAARAAGEAHRRGPPP